MYFKGAWISLEAKHGLYRQSRTKYLRQTLVFMRHGTLEKNFNFHFSKIFIKKRQNFHFGRKTGQ